MQFLTFEIPFDHADCGAMCTNEATEMALKYKQTPHITAKCHCLSKHRLSLHLMESEKQYYMCQEIWQNAANETWHTKSHNFAMKQ